MKRPGEGQGESQGQDEGKGRGTASGGGGGMARSARTTSSAYCAACLGAAPCETDPVAPDLAAADTFGPVLAVAHDSEGSSVATSSGSFVSTSLASSSSGSCDDSALPVAKNSDASTRLSNVSTWQGADGGCPSAAAEESD